MNIAISCCNENSTLEGYDSYDHVWPIFIFYKATEGLAVIICDWTHHLHRPWEQHHSSVDLDGGTCYNLPSISTHPSGNEPWMAYQRYHRMGSPVVSRSLGPLRSMKMSSPKMSEPPDDIRLLPKLLPLYYWTRGVRKKWLHMTMSPLHNGGVFLIDS